MKRRVHSELIKLTATKSPFVFAALAFLAMVLAAFIQVSLGHGRSVVGTSRVAALLMFIYGTDAVPSELRHQTITTTVLVGRPRGHVILAKGLVHAAVGAVVGLLVALFGVLIAALASSDSIGSGGHVARTVVGVSALTGLCAALGVGVGAMVRNQIAAVAAALLWVFVVEHTLAGSYAVVARFGLGGASTALALDSHTIRSGVPALSQPLGGLVVLIWATVAIIVGAVILSRRDIA